MNFKKTRIVLSITIVCLLLCIIFIGYIYIGSGSKEIRAAKKFISLLYLEDIVSESEELKSISYESTKKNDSANQREYYVINTRDFGIDIDSDYDVVGFKNKVCTVGETRVSEEEAIKLAKEYLDKIYYGDVGYKETIKDETQVTPYYSLVFTKQKNGYPFYKDQIVINIDKEMGTLDGYSNMSTIGKPKRAKIKVEQSEAERTALNEFSTLSGEAKISEDTFKAFYMDKDGEETELCYIVSLEGKGIDGKETRWKFFVSTESGSIINTIKDVVRETKVS